MLLGLFSQRWRERRESYLPDFITHCPNTEDPCMAHPFPLFEQIWTPPREVFVNSRNHLRP